MQCKEGDTDTTQPPPDPFTELIQALRQALQPPVTVTRLSASVSPMAWSTVYSGESKECSIFLLQCLLFFETALITATMG